MDNLKRILSIQPSKVDQIFSKYGVYRKPPPSNSPQDTKNEDSSGTRTNQSMLGKRVHSDIVQN